MVEDTPRSGDMLITRVGQMTFALPVAHVVETMRPLPTERIAGAPPSVRGHVTVRGVEIPVIELAHVLGTESAPRQRDGGAAMRFVVVRAGDRLVALAVDAVLGVGPLTEAAMTGGGVVGALGVLDASLRAVLDAGRVMPAIAAR